MKRAFAASAVAFLVVCAPMGLAAQERREQALVLDWFSGIWSTVAAWLAPSPAGDGSCPLDPNWCPRGAAGAAQSQTDSTGDGRCSLDPNGCPDGA